jgi:hypothetical protein
LRNVLTWLAVVLAGLALGIGGAIFSLRTASFGDDIRIGPWTTGRNVGTADADIRTRAIVALRGLLALPASEARYFTARVDSAGRALDGRCMYRLAGVFSSSLTRGGTPARWLSITVYDRAGWLIPNPTGRHSVGSSEMMPGNDGWRIWVSPNSSDTAADMRATDNWIPTGTSGPFEITLRAYRPDTDLSEAAFLRSLPQLDRVECPS